MPPTVLRPRQSDLPVSLYYHHTQHMPATLPVLRMLAVALATRAAQPRAPNSQIATAIT